MLAKANSRSASETSSTWSKRATALRTCCASVNGSLRCFGKANTVSGSVPRVLGDSGSPNGAQVALTFDMLHLQYFLRGVPTSLTLGQRLENESIRRWYRAMLFILAHSSQ